MKSFVLAFMFVLGSFAEANAAGFAISPFRGFVITQKYSQPQPKAQPKAQSPQVRSSCANGQCAPSHRVTLLQKLRGF